MPERPKRRSIPLKGISDPHDSGRTGRHARYETAAGRSLGLQLLALDCISEIAAVRQYRSLTFDQHEGHPYTGSTSRFEPYYPP